MTLTALICAKNEEDFVDICLSSIHDFVDEIIFVNNSSIDNTGELAKKFSKVKYFDYPSTTDMSAVRNFSLSKATGTWILQLDLDEIYPASEMQKIREFIDSTDVISARVHYKNLSWRSGYAQKDFGHYPDRLYRRDVIDAYRGVLPIDMTYVKKEFLRSPNKTKGDIGPLEYDNDTDSSEVHPLQPIIDVTYYHLARTRGYWFEYQKQINYQKILHPLWGEYECRDSALINHWVTGRYEIEPIEVPQGIPTKTIPSPKVSVIITNFEYEKWVGEAIQSVLDQTYKAYEIIVVDDCSYDNSRAIIEKYPVTKIFRPQNGGPAAARNEGIARSTGDYFLLLDADDRLKPDAIENMLKSAMETGAEVTYGDLEWIGELSGVWPFPDYDKEEMLEAQLVPSVCALVDRHAFDCSGGFRIDCQLEDYYFWLTLSQTLNLQFKHIPVVTLEYRDHHSEKGCRSDFGNIARPAMSIEFKKNFNIKW